MKLCRCCGRRTDMCECQFEAWNVDSVHHFAWCSVHQQVIGLHDGDDLTTEHKDKVLVPQPIEDHIAENAFDD